MYLVDTNFLGQLASVYPPDVLPSLWEELETSLFSPDVYFHEEVHNETKRWGHPRLKWYLEHVQPSQIFTPDDEELVAYQKVSDWVVNKRVPAYKDAAINEFLNVADSWLVASAYRHGATVVTNEVAAPDGIKKVKIPDVTVAFGVTCINTLEFLRRLQVSV